MVLAVTLFNLAQGARTPGLDSLRHDFVWVTPLQATREQRGYLVPSTSRRGQFFCLKGCGREIEFVAGSVL